MHCRFGHFWQVSGSGTDLAKTGSSRSPPCCFTTLWGVISAWNCRAARLGWGENTSVVIAFILVPTFKPLLVQNTHFLCSLSFPFLSRGGTLLYRLPLYFSFWEKKHHIYFYIGEMYWEKAVMLFKYEITFAPNCCCCSPTCTHFLMGFFSRFPSFFPRFLSSAERITKLCLQKWGEKTQNKHKTHVLFFVGWRQSGGHNIFYPFKD